MNIFYVSDLYGNSRYMKQIIGICKMLKPTLSIFNGNIFPYKINGDLNLFYMQYASFFNELCDFTQVIIQYGNDDIYLDAIQFNKYLDNRVKDITNSLYDFNEYQILATNYCPNWYINERKDWTRRDGKYFKQYKEYRQGIISNVHDGRLVYIKDLNYHLNNLPTHEEEIKDDIDMVRNIEKTIILSCSPPIGLLLDYTSNMGSQGSYTIRKLCEGDYTKNNQPFLCLSSGFMYSPDLTGTFSYQLQKCLCLNSGQGQGVLKHMFFTVSDSSVQLLTHSTLKYINPNNVKMIVNQQE